MKHTFLFHLPCIGVFLLLASMTPSSAPGQERFTPKWEFKAVSFGTDDGENTKKLNDLARDEWEYVGPLAHGMVAFRRSTLSASYLRDRARELAQHKELQALQGTWEVAGDSAKIEINTGQIDWWNKGILFRTGYIRIVDPSAKPKTFDIHYTEKGGTERIFKGIYSIEGDTLQFCGTDGRERPKEFKAEENIRCFVWKRAKK